MPVPFLKYVSNKSEVEVGGPINNVFRREISLTSHPVSMFKHQLSSFK